MMDEVAYMGTNPYRTHVYNVFSMSDPKKNITLVATRVILWNLECQLLRKFMIGGEVAWKKHRLSLKSMLKR